MIRKIQIDDRKDIDEMQFKLQKYFSGIDQTHESLQYKDLNDTNSEEWLEYRNHESLQHKDLGHAHLYM